MGEAARFYRQWFKRVVWRSPGVADGYAGLVGTLASIAAHYRPEISRVMESWAWQIPLWAFGAILIVRFFSAPFAIWKEDQARLLHLDTQEKQKAKREALGLFLAQGSALQRRCADETVPPPDDEAQEWMERVVTFLHDSLDDSYIARIADASVVPMGATGIQSQGHRQLWSGLRIRNYHLQQFIQEVR